MKFIFIFICLCTLFVVFAAHQSATLDASYLDRVELLLNATRQSCMKFVSPLPHGNMNHAENPSLSVIIGAYERYAAVFAIVRSLRRQKMMGAVEIILSDAKYPNQV